MDYEQIVTSHYEGLYGFAYSLAGNSDDACELTQETFARLLAKGGQLRDRSKAKPWLFTTLYRIYLGWKRREALLPHLDICSVQFELPFVTPELVDPLQRHTDVQTVLENADHDRHPPLL